MQTHLRWRTFRTVLLILIGSGILWILPHPWRDSTQSRTNSTVSPHVSGAVTLQLATESPLSKATTPVAPSGLSLNGEAAKEQLRKSGQNESLGAALAAARHAIEKLDPAAPHSRGAEFFAANPKQRLRAWFRHDGVELASGGKFRDGHAAPWSVALRLRASGRPGALRDAVPARTQAEGSRVEMVAADGLITQWFENRGHGIEQGFTLYRRPEGKAGEVVVQMEVEGSLRATLAEGAVNFVNDQGAEVLRYSELRAWDASGRELRSRIDVQGNALALLVVDAGAQYPITIDPLFANVEARLVEESAAGDWFGWSVALDGETALVGAKVDDTTAGDDAGSAYVFVRSGTNWSQQAKLIASDGVAYNKFGTSVALSGDTALIGAPNGSKAYVFVRRGTNWSQEAKLIADTGSAGVRFGASVALSGDIALIGASVVIGSWVDDLNAESDARSAYVFVRSGTDWSPPYLLTASDGAGGDYFGSSLALSGDTALVGAPSDDTFAGGDAGSAYVFVRSGMNWSPQSKLTASNGRADDHFGHSVALSGDTVLIGARNATTGAYVFVRSGTNWNPQAGLNASDGGLGGPVALSGDTALVGAGESAYVFVRHGASWDQQDKLMASERAPYDSFGTSVALSGETALVGAWGRDHGAGIDAGSAYVFVRSGTNWNRQKELMASLGTEYDLFGTSVALSGDTAVVGAVTDDTSAAGNAGSAYVFVRSGTSWVQQAKLTASDGADWDSFGSSVALSGDTALVGARYADTPDGIHAGSAFVFVRSGAFWSQQAKLIASGGAANDNFANSVALSGDTALVGAPGDDTPDRSEPGSAYVFVRSGTNWGLPYKLTTSAVGNKFGTAVALSGETALVGASSDDSLAGANAGSAHVFVRSGMNWIPQDTLTASDGAGDDFFGTSVALSGDTALVGAVGSDTPGGGDAGSAYVFIRNGTIWTQRAKLTASDGANFDNFGSSVALSADTALIGAAGDDTPAGGNAGSAYVFGHNGSTWIEQMKLTSGVDASVGDNFGASVALSGNTALVGANADDTGGRQAGSAYVFLLGELPLINEQPESRTVRPDTAVTFRVAATGYAPLRYQWRRDGFEIPGANQPSLAIQVPAQAPFDTVDGVYDVLVSNLGGVATSAPAALRVNALSNFSQASPGAPLDAQGLVLVNLTPTDIGAGWRFVGEQEWRESGVPARGLVRGDREIEFRPVPRYYQPLRESVSVIGEAATVIDREYYENGSAATGALTVVLKPDSVAKADVPVANRAQWRLLGSGNQEDPNDLTTSPTWQDSVAIIPQLPAGFYLVECKPVAGYTTPAPLAVKVQDAQTSTAVATYFLADAPAGTTPGVLPFETVTGSAQLPYQYVGQIRSDSGVSTGFVVKPRVVATAGHVVFDDAKLTAAPLGTPTATGSELKPFGATGLHWLFQRDRGSYEPKMQTPRGFYVLAGYAAQRIVDGTPGQSTPASQNLDVAALFFLEDASRGGFGGYLASDSDENEFLTSPSLKTLVGYPVGGTTLAANRGRMHATPPADVMFERVLGDFLPGVPFRIYTTSEITSFGGNSGGPVCVQFEGGNYYPAAIYLGGANKTVVRAIDGQVVDLFKRAELSVSTDGEDHTGGGITLVSSTPSANAFAPAALRVNLSLPGARWKIGAKGTLRAGGAAGQLNSASPGSYTVFFTAVSGFNAPAPVDVTLEKGKLTTVDATYRLIAKPTVTGPALVRQVSNQPFSFLITAQDEPTSFSASGLAEAKLTLDPATGRISSLGAARGSYELHTVATNLAGSSAPFKITVVIADPGELVVQADPAAGKVTVEPKSAGNLFPQGETVTLTAKANAPAFLFEGWEFAGASPTSLSTPRTRVTIPTVSAGQPAPNVVATAKFIANPYLKLAGAFAGLIDGASPALDTAGFTSLMLTKTGGFTLNISLAGKRYTLKGQLDPRGNFSGVLPKTTIPVTLHLDLAGGGARFDGSLTIGGADLDIRGTRTLTTSAAQEGKFTLLFPADPDQAGDVTYPKGNGYATMQVTKAGAARFAGLLGDGSQISFGGTFLNDGTLPIFVQTSAGAGVVTGTLKFHKDSIDFLDGKLSWFRLRKPTAKYYPNAFNGEFEVAGSRYLPPTTQSPVLHIPNGGKLSFTGGAVTPQPADVMVTLDSKNKLRADPPVPKFSIGVSAASGLFHGKFLDAGLGKQNSFTGVLLQRENRGGGLFLGNQRETGLIELLPLP